MIIGSSREQCSGDLQTMLSTFSELSLPVVENKLDRPSTCLTSLGFELDSRALEMRLPRVKLLELQQTSSAWVGRRSCRKKELESVVGKLPHASRVVQPGKTFLRQLFELLKGTHKGFHHIRLNVSARSDIYWWSTFVQSWNSVSLLREVGKEEVDHYVTTDASGQVGCGGLWHNRWFQICWMPEYRIFKPFTLLTFHNGYILKGLKRKVINSNARPRLLMTPEILKAMKEVWRIDSDCNKATMLWAAACTCFFGFLRSGKVVVPSDSEYDPVVHLSFGDVRLDNTTDPQFLEVTIKVSKMGPFRQGVQVYLGRTNTDLCPVAVVLSYMVYRRTDSGPFFRYTRIRALTRERFVGDVRSALQAAGIDSERNSRHRFRIGAASTATRCRLQHSLIKTLGQWERMAYSLYIRTPRETLCTVSCLLVTCQTEKPVSVTTS